MYFLQNNPAVTWFLAGEHIVSQSWCDYFVPSWALPAAVSENSLQTSEISVFDAVCKVSAEWVLNSVEMLDWVCYRCLFSFTAAYTWVVFIGILSVRSKWVYASGVIQHFVARPRTEGEGAALNAGMTMKMVRTIKAVTSGSHWASVSCMHLFVLWLVCVNTSYFSNTLHTSMTPSRLRLHEVPDSWCICG